MKQKILDEFKKRLKDIYLNDEDYLLGRVGYDPDLASVAFEEVAASILGFGINEIVNDARTAVAEVKNEIKAEKANNFNAASSNESTILSGNLTSKDELFSKFKELISINTIRASYDRSVKVCESSFTSLFNTFHKSGEIHEWFKELVIDILANSVRIDASGDFDKFSLLVSYGKYFIA